MDFGFNIRNTNGPKNPAQRVNREANKNKDEIQI